MGLSYQETIVRLAVQVAMLVGDEHAQAEPAAHGASQNRGRSSHAAVRRRFRQPIAAACRIRP